MNNVLKVLVVVAANYDLSEYNFKIHWSFVNEQILAIKRISNVSFDVFEIKGKGIIGYLSNLKLLKSKLAKKKYDIIHAHYGLSGLLAILQRDVPVIVTYHGSDINKPLHNFFSSIAGLFTSGNIFVTESLVRKIFIKPPKKTEIIPCGIDLELFYPTDKKLARNYFNFEQNKKLVLFSSNFSNSIKNAPLAIKAVKFLPDVELIELKDYTRQEVNLLLNAVDLLLLTSFSEGSPMVIKEAMACNCPIVSVDVGDIKEVIGETKNCHITSFVPEEIAKKIKLVLSTKERSDGRARISSFDLNYLSKKVLFLYKNIISEKVISITN